MYANRAITDHVKGAAPPAVTNLKDLLKGLIARAGDETQLETVGMRSEKREALDRRLNVIYHICLCRRGNALGFVDKIQPCCDIVHAA